jgi:type II secretory pathway pseudopilin PulG
MRRRHRGAFTLVEVLAAMAFLGILMPVVISALFVSSRAAVIAERSTIAMQLGENRLNEMMLGGAWSSEGRSGTFGDQWPGYRWELSKSSWETTSMTELTLDVFYKVQGVERSLQLSTLANEALTEAQQSQ